MTERIEPLRASVDAREEPRGRVGAPQLVATVLVDGLGHDAPLVLELRVDRAAYGAHAGAGEPDLLAAFGAWAERSALRLAERMLRATP